MRRPRITTLLIALVGLCGLATSGCARLQQGWREDMRSFHQYGERISHSNEAEGPFSRRVRHAFSDSDPHGSTWDSIRFGWSADQDQFR